VYICRSTKLLAAILTEPLAVQVVFVAEMEQDNAVSVIDDVVVDVSVPLRSAMVSGVLDSVTFGSCTRYTISLVAVQATGTQVRGVRVVVSLDVPAATVSVEPDPAATCTKGD
jgi:hypothetical protein